MYVIAVYDISTVDAKGQRRLNKMMKLMRKYLHHTQKSVFEGELSEAKFFSLKKSAVGIIDNNFDYVIFFRIDNKNNIIRESIGIDFNPTENLI